MGPDLKFDKSIKKFNGDFSANFSGSSFNDLKGIFSGKNISYFKTKKRSLKSILFNFKNTPNKKSIVLKSKIGNGFLSGNFNLNDIRQEFKNTFRSYINKSK